jgi:hypothetical protein
MTRDEYDRLVRGRQDAGAWTYHGEDIDRLRQEIESVRKEHREDYAQILKIIGELLRLIK